MRDFMTKVVLPDTDGIAIDIRSRAMCMGSCFATHIGERLAELLPFGQMEINPFGALYNPLSIAQALNSLAADTPFEADRYIFNGGDGLWHSWLHAGSFSAPTQSACLSNVNERLNAARRSARQIDLLCLTWGTAEVFELNAPTAAQAADETPQGSFVVANCHKENAARFQRRRASIEEIVSATQQALKRLREQRPQLRVVLTISPYRYAGRGLHASTLTKAVLHLAAEQLTLRDASVTYFPAYEIVIDELRDYRFYDRDMLHPSAEAIDYVWERFSDWCFTPQLREYAAECAQLLAAERHRPLHTDSETYTKFLELAQKRRESFKKKWGTLPASR